MGPVPSAPSQTTGSTTKYRDATIAAAYTARGTERAGSFISPTWHVAASKAGAAKPIR